jgi:hypothetical protein
MGWLIGAIIVELVLVAVGLRLERPER